MANASDIQEDTVQGETPSAPAASEVAQQEPEGGATAPGHGDGGRMIGEAEVERLRVELKDTKDRLLRQVAEFQNYKRRTEQEKLTLVQTGQAHVLQRMLEILDDLGRSLQAASLREGEPQSLDPMYVKLKEGVELVYRKLNDEMIRLGVVPIEAVGRPFNENEHDALMQQPAPDNMEAGMVINELQKGYRMGDRVIRHSKVVVST
jgi:molecular chaperone GrpE